jgi:thioredoxin-like negative regulator of GroEL
VDPDHADVRFNLAVALALQGELGAAAEHLRILLRQDPSDSSARLQLARVYHQEGRNTDARRELRLLLHDYPAAPESGAARDLLGEMQAG